MRWFEDLRVGEEFDLGTFTFTADDIVAFARRYDPQPFHVDRAAAQASQFGELCASGWHTAAVWMRLFVAYHRRRADLDPVNEPLDTIGPSPGFQDLSWRRPVCMGDVIHYKTRIAETRALRSRPEWGLVTHRSEGWNQSGALAFAFLGHVFVRRRPV